MRRDVDADRCAGMTVRMDDGLRVHVEQVMVRMMGIELYCRDEDGREVVIIVPPRTRLAVA